MRFHGLCFKKQSWESEKRRESIDLCGEFDLPSVRINTLRMNPIHLVTWSAQSDSYQNKRTSKLERFATMFSRYSHHYSQSTEWEKKDCTDELLPVCLSVVLWAVELFIAEEEEKLQFTNMGSKLRFFAESFVHMNFSHRPAKTIWLSMASTSPMLKSFGRFGCPVQPRRPTLFQWKPNVTQIARSVFIKGTSFAHIDWWIVHAHYGVLYQLTETFE